MSALRPSLWVLLPIVLPVVLLAACSRTEPAPEPLRAVRTLVVSDGQAPASMDFAAEVRARTETRLGFRVGGKLSQRAVEVGQVVRAGQLLAQLDPQDLQLAQQAARSALRAADVAAAQAQADLERVRGLHSQGFISAAELQRRDTSWQAAQAQQAQARAQADVQANQAGYSRLLAPADGVVLAAEAEPGMVLAAGAPVLRLAHAGARDVVFAVPEDRVDAVRGLLGRAGAVSVQPWGGEEAVPARIREVAAAADPVTRTFLVKADLGAAALDLGQTATVHIALPAGAGVARLPLSALWQQQGRTVVWLLDPAAMTVRVQPVQVAGADGNVALVGAGLSPGHEVVTAGVHVLSDGQKVSRYIVGAGAAATRATPPGAAASATAAAAASSR